MNPNLIIHLPIFNLQLNPTLKLRNLLDPREMMLIKILTVMSMKIGQVHIG